MKAGALKRKMRKSSLSPEDQKTLDRIIEQSKRWGCFTMGQLMEKLDEQYEALLPFAKYYDLNDCQERKPDDALEVPICDLRRAKLVTDRVRPDSQQNEKVTEGSK